MKEHQQNISTCLGLVGLLIIARSIRLITKFGSATDIPAQFIERNISIRRRLRNITEKGLEVEHIPIYVPLLSQPVTLLDVRLAGVELTSEGQDWIGQQLRWCALFFQGSVFNTCVNEELLRHGLASTSPFVGLDPHSWIYWHLYKRFLRAESRAEKKGKGLWMEESHCERNISLHTCPYLLNMKTDISNTLWCCIILTLSMLYYTCSIGYNRYIPDKRKVFELFPAPINPYPTDLSVFSFLGRWGSALS
uniref:Chromosome 3 open reading frame 33 n=1 Tax=Cyprinus carpio carpio TaxID=630221 RepID=A0A8C1EJ11_CYPCA